MALEIDEARIRRAERWERELSEMPPEHCLGIAAMLRDVKPELPRQGTRDLAERMAREFEERAAANSSRGPV